MNDLTIDILYRDGEPCKHVGCICHITHPCEGCGRVNAKGIVYKTSPNKKLSEIQSEEL